MNRFFNLPQTTICGVASSEFTELHWAIRNGQYIQLENLLRSGANPNQRVLDVSGCTPLIMTLQQRDETAFNLLLKYNADVNLGCGVRKNTNQIIPIIVALERRNSVRVIRSLIAAGANPYLEQESVNTQNAFEYCMRYIPEIQRENYLLELNKTNHRPFKKFDY